MISQIQQYTTSPNRRSRTFVQKMKAPSSETRSAGCSSRFSRRRRPRRILPDSRQCLSKAALASFIMLVLSGIAAALGGLLGRVSGIVRV